MAKHTDDPQNGRHDNSQPADQGLSLVPGRGQRPQVSLAALGEKVAAQFREETGQRADILLELGTEASRRTLLREITDFVLAVEAVTLAHAERSAVIDHAYRELFSFGPLDGVLADESVTAIAIQGPAAVHVQRGMGQLERVDVAFEDRAHLADVLRRVLATQGATFDEHSPFLEVGAVMVGRAARISVAGPPVSLELSVDIRLHPRQPLTLDDLVTPLDVLPPQAAVLLRAIVRAGHGLVIVGDVALGKTTLAGVLLRELPDEVIESGGVIAVERAAEMALPPGVTRRVAGQGAPEQEAEDEPGDFASAIAAALEQSPARLAVDEVRGDEAAAIWQALVGVEDAPGYLWVFRGDPRPDRLRSALSMVIRRHDQAMSFAAVYGAIARRLPFVVALKRAAGMPRLAQIAVWALHEGAEDTETSLELVPLLWPEADGWMTAQTPPGLALDLPDGFWGG